MSERAFRYSNNRKREKKSGYALHSETEPEQDEPKPNRSLVKLKALERNPALLSYSASVAKAVNSYYSDFGRKEVSMEVVDSMLVNDLSEIARLVEKNENEEEVIDPMEMYTDLNSIDILIRRMQTLWDMSSSRFSNEYVRRKSCRNDLVFTAKDGDGFFTDLKKDLEFTYLSEKLQLDSVRKLIAKKESIEKRLIESVQSPDATKKLIRELHDSEIRINDNLLDKIIGINPEDSEVSVRANSDNLRAAHPNEELWLWGSRTNWTPYDYIRSITKELDLQPHDTVYDLGSGYGQMPLYASMVSQAQCRGIELVPERARSSQAIQQRMELDNLRFEEANVLDVDFSSGNVFYMFNPFSPSTYEAVNEKLQEIAEGKKIKVVAYGAAVNFFERQDWLEVTNSEEWKGY